MKEVCEVCGNEIYLPFVCSYCKGKFCSNHRLPESHNCSYLFLAKVPYRKVEQEIGIIKKRRILPEVSLRISRKECKDLLIAWIVLSFCLSSLWLFRFSILFPIFFAISLITAGLGFILHELAHKYIAQWFGYWAEFRLWVLGIFLALSTAILTGGRMIFAAPGAVFIFPRSFFYEFRNLRRESGIISLAGPLTNICLAFLFLTLRRLTSGFWELLLNQGLFINVWLAFFNLIPFPPMDGHKVFQWSKAVWTFCILSSAFMMILFT